MHKTQTCKMKIGIDIRNIGKKRTGDEVVFLNLIKHLSKIDTKNTYILLLENRSTENIKAVCDLLEINNKRNFTVKSIGSGNKFVWNFWTLPMYLKNNRIDVYHTQYITPFFIPNTTKIITHIHDISFKVFPELIKPLDRFFLDLLIPRSLKNSTVIVAVSNFTKQEITEKYSIESEKIEVVPNAVSENFIRTHSVHIDQKDILKQKYNLPDLYILYVGTMQPRKNLPMLIQAFSILSKKLPNIHLVLVGNKKGHFVDSRINETIERLSLQDKIVFPGFVDEQDLPYIYAQASVFVYPSIYEGFGIPLLEAMSQNTPVIASDTSVHKEIAGNAALYFQLNDLDKLSDLLYDSLTDISVAEQLKAAGNKRLDIYSWSYSASILHKIYERFSK